VGGLAVWVGRIWKKRRTREITSTSVARVNFCLITVWCNIYSDVDDVNINSIAPCLESNPTSRYLAISLSPIRLLLCLFWPARKKLRRICHCLFSSSWVDHVNVRVSPLGFFWGEGWGADSHCYSNRWGGGFACWLHGSFQFRCLNASPGQQSIAYIFYISYTRDIYSCRW
jgi:hypothetical protein